MTDTIVVIQQVSQIVTVVTQGPQGLPGNTAILGTVNEWTRQQYYALSTLAINGDNSIDWNWNTQPEAKVNLSNGVLYFLNMPTNRQPGVKTLRVYQNTIGGGVLIPNAGYIIDTSLLSVTFAANTFIDLYCKDDGTYIVLSGAQYSTV